MLGHIKDEYQMYKDENEDSKEVSESNHKNESIDNSEDEPDEKPLLTEYRCISDLSDISDIGFSDEYTSISIKDVLFL